MSEEQVIVTLEDGFGRVQTSIITSLPAPKLMDKIIEIDEQQDTISRLEEENERLKEEKERLQKDVENLQEVVAELLADATRNGYLPPLDDFVKG